MEVQIDGAVGGAGDEAEESGGQLGGEEEEEDYVGPGVWHIGAPCVGWVRGFGYEGEGGLVLWGRGGLIC